MNLAILGSAFATGVASSIGPCSVPRILAVRSLCDAHDVRDRRRGVAAFVAGVAVGYVALGACSGFAGWAFSTSPYAYAMMSAACVSMGVVAIVRAGFHECRAAHGCGKGFLAGLTSSALTSPCCAPIAAALASLASWDNRTVTCVAIVASFALGQTLPLIAFAAVAQRMRALLVGVVSAPAYGTIAGALTVALGAYYAVLA